MIAPLVTISILAASILAASNLAASNLPASAQGPATTVAAEERPARERTELDGIVADARVGESTSEVGLPITYTVLIARVAARPEDASCACFGAQKPVTRTTVVERITRRG